MLKLDKNVPIPKPLRPAHGVYPFRHMKVGESFFVPGKNINQISKMADYYRKFTEHTYLKRTVIENGVKGVRVWRVK